MNMKTNKNLLVKVINRISAYFKRPRLYQFISKKEYKNLNKKDRFTSGQSILNGSPVMYSDYLGFIHSTEEIFVDECYKFNSLNKNPLIIDCGTNIGISIIYFKTLYPDAKIIAFEPDTKIFSLLEKNLARFNHIELHNTGVWIDDAFLNFYSEGSLAGSFVVDFENKTDIIKTPTLRLKSFLNQKVDFLKIDIEGTENDLMADLEPELKNVENIFLEYHSITGLDQKLGEILNILSRSGFRYYIKEATNISNHPFLGISTTNFDMQLNIFGYRDNSSNPSKVY